MPKGREELGIGDLRKCRPVGRAIADWLHDHKATDVSWFKTVHGHVHFTICGKDYSLVFPTTPRDGDNAAKRALAALRKMVI